MPRTVSAHGFPYSTPLAPDAALEAWGVGRGDALELTDRCIRPVRRKGSAHDALDELP